MTSRTDILASLKGRRIGVVGGGVSGLAAAKLLIAKGADVFVSDSAKTPLPLDVRNELGGHTDALFDRELLVLSPGVKPTHPVLVEAAKRGIPTCGEIELGYSQLPRTIRYACVTGTNGKTTTTALLGHIVRTAGRNVFVGGNIGEPLCNLALIGVAPEIAVLELSSYQCEGLYDFSAEVAVLLNITPDHLERYGTIEAYAAAKARLFELQQVSATSVLNKDDRFCRSLGPRLKTSLLWFSADDTTTIDFSKSQLLGRHNRENQIAAIGAARALGIKDEAIQRGIDSFGGVEHRIEKFAVVNGVTWFNDSKATNDDAAAKALAAVPAPIVWLAGGRDKGGGYALSEQAAGGKVKLAIVFGEAAALIEAAVRDVCTVERVENLAEAVKRAAAIAVKGDSVLLSPACSSFDQFKNYEERGKTFKALVRELEVQR